MPKKIRPYIAHVSGFFSEAVTLSSARGRIFFFCMLTGILLIIPYHTLESTHLSVYAWLKLPSPSVGLTRAYWKLIHGDVVGAWHRNALIFVIVAVWSFVMGRDSHTLYARHKA